MAQNFGKRLHRLHAPEEGQRERAVEQLREWGSKPLHRWIPAAQIEQTGMATITDRQAQFLHFELKRRGINADFEPAEPRQ
jgi:hypothetical protein